MKARKKAKNLLCLLTLAIPLNGLAWVSGDESLRGPARAQFPHAPTELNNEHGLLWQQSMQLSGLPQELISNFSLIYWTDTDGFPAPLRSTTIRSTRTYALDGMSALPDHSFSLWDWAAGNLTCPIGAPDGSAQACHAAIGHMGPVGASHFPPQAQLTYAHYHAQAMNRARQCGTLTDTLDNATPAIDADLPADDFIRECEREALLLEAFGQHFLQDAWAIGHMWERWGSADIRTFTDDDLAEAVAMGAALIHGAEVILDVNDDLSSSVSENVAYAHNGVVSPGTGDLHLAELNSNALYDAQRTGLYRCAAAGIRAVYSETRMRSGVMDAYSGPGTAATDAELLGESCFGQRATDEAMLEAIGLSDTEIEKEVQLVGASTLVRTNGAELDDLSDLFRLELLRLLAISWLSGIEGDSGLPVEGLASGGGAMSTFMGVASNAEFNNLAPYIDPEITTDWPLSGSENIAAQDDDFDARPTRVMARVFNRSHLTGWCNDAEARPSLLRNRFQANPTSARLALCEEFTARHVRPEGGQSLCEAVGLGSFTILAEAPQNAAETAGLYCDPPPPLEITTQLIEPNPWVASVQVNLPEPGGSDTDNGNSLPIDLFAEESDDNYQLEAELTSEVDIDNDGTSATISGSVSGRLALARSGLLSGGEATGSIEWSVSFTVSTPADYRLSVTSSGSSSGFLLNDCVGSIGVQLTQSTSGDLQAFYAGGCGVSYPDNLTEEVERERLEAGTYLLTITSDTPEASDWLLEGGLLDAELLIDTTFELELVEEGEDF